MNEREPSSMEFDGRCAGPPALRSALGKPVDIGPLVYFRMLFGAILTWEVYRFFAHGWVERYYVDPEFFFKYYGFAWIRPWPGIGMYVHFIGLGLLAVCILWGLYYRAATVLFFFGFTYVFLLDQANYLNHFYLISLVSLLLIFLPANRALSLDALMRPEIRTNVAPAWTLWLLRFQLGVVYFYGGLAKLDSDWLAGAPMRMWLAERTDFPLVGAYFTEHWLVMAFSYGGLLFDLLIVPLLLFRPTRWFGLIWLVAFHLVNFKLFDIGIFPWFMLLATPVFLPTSWTRRGIRVFGSENEMESYERDRREPATSLSRWQAAAVGGYVALQLIVPLRHWVYPGNANWTEEGHRFAWHMKLRDKDADASFVVHDVASGRTWDIDPADYLTRRQRRKMSTRPYMIVQFSHHLADLWRKNGYEHVEVRARVNASLNGRRPQPLVDPAVDLSKEVRSLLPRTWIEPLQVELDDTGT